MQLEAIFSRCVAIPGLPNSEALIRHRSLHSRLQRVIVLLPIFPGLVGHSSERDSWGFVVRARMRRIRCDLCTKVAPRHAETLWSCTD